MSVSAPNAQYIYIEAEGIRIDHIPNVGWRVKDGELERYVSTLPDHERKLFYDVLGRNTTDGPWLCPHDVELALYNMERVRLGRKVIWSD
jgi:hypothetical protein